MKSTPAFFVLSITSENVWSAVIPESAFRGERGAVESASVIGGAFEKATPSARVTAIFWTGVVDASVALTLAAFFAPIIITARLFRVRLFSWGGNPGVGSLHRFRDAIQNRWPIPLEIEEHSHADMAARYQAGASGLPFAVLRGYVGSDIPKYNRSISSVACPFTGEVLTATRALTPDVAIIHAQKADRRGNVLIQGIIGIQKEAVLASKKAIVTVEEIVYKLDAPMNAISPFQLVGAP